MCYRLRVCILVNSIETSKAAVSMTNTEPSELNSASSTLSGVSVSGFCLVAAWHFLVVFGAVFGPSVQASATSFSPQVSLYVSLALSYLIIGSCGPLYRKWFMDQSKRGTYITLGLFIALAIGAAVFTMSGASFPSDAMLLCYVALGFITAVMIFPWLTTPLDSASGLSVFKNMAFNMGLGSVIALGITFIPYPYCYIAVFLLPALSTFVYMINQIKQDKHGRKYDPWTQEMSPEQELKISDMIGPCMLFFLYSVVFGFSQGSFSQAQNGSTDWILVGGWPALGATLSAIVLMLLPKKYLERYGLMTIQQASVIIMSIGVFMTMFFTLNTVEMSSPQAWAGECSSRAITFAGFNVFEFGFMVFAFAWATKFGSNLIPFIGMNRGMLYGGLALGLLAGDTLRHFLGTSIVLYLISSAIIVLALMVYLMPFITDVVPYDMWPNDSVGELDGDSIEPDFPSLAAVTQKEDEEPVDHWQAAVDELALAHNLSKREKEVFTYLARGRNAAFIQQELFISIHTVKTHIANIYRKLEVHSIQEVLDIVESAVQQKTNSR